MNLTEKLHELNKDNKQFIVATVVKVKGSVPGKVGFKMIVEPNRITHGTVGGGAIEEQVKTDALELLSSGTNKMREYLLSDKVENSNSDVTVVSMKCQGKVWVFFEVSGKLPAVYVFGGGHVGQALLKSLSDLNYHTILVDNREEYANDSKNKSASEIICADYIKYSNEFEPAADSFIVILTHGHSFDYEILKAVYSRNLNVKYIGAIASKNKAKELRKKLKSELGDNLDLSKLSSPIGLKIGGITASEIALSIAAEMQSVRYNHKE